MKTITDKAELVNEGIKQGLKIGKDIRLQKMRKLFYLIVLSLDEEELYILFKVLQQYYLNAEKQTERSKGDD